MIKRLIFAAMLAVLPADACALTALHVETANGSYAIIPSDTVNARVLAANTAESALVPPYTDSMGRTKFANYVLFSPKGCDFYAGFNGTAAVPASDVTNGSASEINPTIRYLGGSFASISLISDSACTVGLSFYK